MQVLFSTPAVPLGPKRGKVYAIDDAEERLERSAVKGNYRKRKAALSLKVMSRGHVVIVQRVFLYGRNSPGEWSERYWGRARKGRGDGNEV